VIEPLLDRDRREEEDLGEEFGREGEKAVVTTKVIATAAAWIFIVSITGLRSDGDGDGDGDEEGEDEVGDCRY